MNLFTITVTTVVMWIVFVQTPITTETRHLKKTDGQDHFKLGYTDGFVPTSPGMGHKKGNANVEEFEDDFKPTEGRRLQKTNGFASTSPGNSPGIGHKKGNVNIGGFKEDLKTTQGRRMQKTNSRSTDDFAPTTPGNSPGVGHKEGNANVQESEDDLEPKEERRLHKPDGQKHFKAGYTDDFAPTTPGNSPGMGHKKGDGFKPTTPGHSPGIGHALKNDGPDQA